MSHKSHACFCAYNRTMDLETPRNVKLTAFYRRSFAFYTVKDRLPVILTKIIDTLSQKKDEIAEEFSAEARNDIKEVIGKISLLKYRFQTNKPLEKIDSNEPDALIYNHYIDERRDWNGPPTPFHSIWLLVECYMYRKVREAFEKSTYLKDLDPFRWGKQELFLNGLTQIKEIAKLLKKMRSSEVDKQNFFTLLQMNLWSNKSDLSFSVEGGEYAGNDLEKLSEFILVDDSEKIWEAISGTAGGTIDYIMDNAGPELIADLALADYLISNELCDTITFHAKIIPWFISDASIKDLEWTLGYLTEKGRDFSLKRTGKRWLDYIEEKRWVFKSEHFWTSPVYYEYMHRYDPKLYQELSKSKLLILKGDLSYRKLFREKNHNPTVTLDEAQGFFAPSPLCIIRVMKAEIVCGLPEGLAEKCSSQSKCWMRSGEYGLIQYTDKIVPKLDYFIPTDNLLLGCTPESLDDETCLSRNCNF